MAYVFQDLLDIISEHGGLVDLLNHTDTTYVTDT